MNERRAYIRVPVGTEGTYQRLGDLSGPHLALTEDISLGGLRLSSSDRLQPGDKVSVALKLPEQGEVDVTGVVVWSRESQQASQRNFEAGLQWSDMNVYAQARINAFVTEYTRSRSYEISSSGFVSAEPARWRFSFVVTAALFLVVVFLVAWAVERHQLLTQTQSLQQTIGFYQETLRSLSSQ